MSEKKTVLLVDDHAVVRRGCRAVLTQEGHVTIVGEASGGLEAIEKAKQLKPDIVIMDLNLPDLNGIDTTRRLKNQHHDLQVIVLSVHTDEVYIYRALEAGASAYIVKEGAVQELLEAVNAIMTGNMYLSPIISRSIVRTYLQRTSLGKLGEDFLLTDKEKEVLQLLTIGRTSKEVAQQLSMSPRTVETHKRNIMKKLEVHTTPELIAYAIRNKLTLTEERP